VTRGVGMVWLDQPSLLVQVPVRAVRLVDMPLRARRAVARRLCVGGLCRRCSASVQRRACPGWRLVGRVARWVGVVKLAGPVLLPCRAGTGPALQSSPGPPVSGKGKPECGWGGVGSPVRRRFDRPGRCRTGDSEGGA